MRHVEGKIFSKRIRKTPCLLETSEHGLRTPSEEIAFTARSKIFPHKKYRQTLCHKGTL